MLLNEFSCCSWYSLVAAYLLSLWKNWRVWQRLRWACRDSFLNRLAEKLRVQISAAFGAHFVLLNHDTVRIGESILANAGDLPGDLDSRFVGLDREVTLIHLLGNHGLGEL